jgi:hypothetical protein
VLQREIYFKWRQILRRQIYYFGLKKYHPRHYVYLQQIQQQTTKKILILIRAMNKKNLQIIVVYRRQEKIVHINQFHM